MLAAAMPSALTDWCGTFNSAFQVSAQFLQDLHSLFASTCVCYLQLRTCVPAEDRRNRSRELRCTFGLASFSRIRGFEGQYRA